VLPKAQLPNQAAESRSARRRARASDHDEGMFDDTELQLALANSLTEQEGGEEGEAEGEEEQAREARHEAPPGAAGSAESAARSAAKGPPEGPPESPPEAASAWVSELEELHRLLALLDRESEACV